MSKEFIVEIELDFIEIRVQAKNKTEARKTKLVRDELDDKLDGLKRLVRDYESNDYESSRSYFPSSFDIDELLIGYMMGRNSRRSVWSEIDRKQDFEPEPTYSTWDNDDDDWSFGGGSFSSGGGIGGGSFSSGSGF